jgi:O-antigen ligase
MILWLIAGYMWLFIHRPFEVWPWMAPLRVERVYMLLLLGVWAVGARKTWDWNVLCGGVFGLIATVLISWTFSPFRDSTWTAVEDYLKVAVFFVILLTSVRDESGLRFVVYALLGATALYMTHSFWEYLNGRYNYRMGTRRMIGVDLSYGNPNAFAGTICYSLAFLMPAWCFAVRNWEKVAVIAYAGLSAACIFLTGSRSGLIGLIWLCLLLILTTRQRFRVLFLLGMLAAVFWNFLPEDRQNRFLTIIDPSLGPQVAQSSAASRIEGFWNGIEIWKSYPLLGVGPDAHPKVSYHGRPLHNLYGQIVADLGTAGLVAFLFLLGGFFANHFYLVRRSESRDALPLPTGKAVMAALSVLLLLGCAGHNLYRYQWLWFAAIQIIAVRVAGSSEGEDSSTGQVADPSGEFDSADNGSEQSP